MTPIADITWGMTFRVWWHFFWRYLLWGLLGGMAVGFVFGIVAALAHVSKESSVLFMLPLILVTAFCIRMWVIRTVLRKKYRIGKYRLALLDDGDAL